MQETKMGATLTRMTVENTGDAFRDSMWPMRTKWEREYEGKEEYSTEAGSVRLAEEHGDTWDEEAVVSGLFLFAT